jgi:hypothetical protein
MSRFDIISGREPVLKVFEDIEENVLKIGNIIYKQDDGYLTKDATKGKLIGLVLGLAIDESLRIRTPKNNEIFLDKRLFEGIIDFRPLDNTIDERATESIILARRLLYHENRFLNQNYQDKDVEELASALMHLSDGLREKLFKQYV